MQTKDITDGMVIGAYEHCAKDAQDMWPYDILILAYNAPFKVCYRAMERAHRRGYIDYGVSLRSGWVTPKGKAYV